MDTFERTIRTIDDVICKNISVFDDKEIFSGNKKEFEQFTKIQSIFEKSLNVKQKELYEKYCSAQNDLDSKY